MAKHNLLYNNVYVFAEWLNMCIWAVDTREFHPSMLHVKLNESLFALSGLTLYESFDTQGLVFKLVN